MAQILFTECYRRQRAWERCLGAGRKAQTVALGIFSRVEGGNRALLHPPSSRHEARSHAWPHSPSGTVAVRRQILEKVQWLSGEYGDHVSA